jgi:hypothetical protein
MAKPTLLDFVQDILSDADGDDVNSITDTVESDQCARVIRDVFDQIIDAQDGALHKTIIQLAATGASTPNVMTRPEGFYNIEWVRYDVKPTAADDQNYGSIIYKAPDEFIRVTSLRTLSDSNVTGVTLDSGHIMLARNDIAPTYYTFMEDYDDIIFDAYDSDLETNLQTSKSLAFGMLKPTLSLTNSAVIDLPKPVSIHIKREARAMYFDLYKDGLTAEVDRTRRRAEVRAQRLRYMTKNTDNDNGPNYGRK